jgi:hypothetical protein
VKWSVYKSYLKASFVFRRIFSIICWHQPVALTGHG